ncbi:Hsp70 family protein [Glycomyces terrestris]|uniref:Hsp70 family protein n=1 Tax=Glycomyces terrestris TaxID=2493553 RepID=A0A426URN0_9ACTN|nr:Hsp70 family protein [Glycomyces terrestris]RRR95822.1 Hsp70 family protein [Glycomyces terrestris]
MHAPVWLAVDLGTTHTVAVIGRGGQEPRSLLFDGSPLLASGVFLDAEGGLHTGRDAQRLAAADPGRFEPHPKRRIDDGTVLLGDRETPVEELLATGLRRVAEEAAASGMRPTDTVLTCPADWGPVRRARLEAAADLAGMGPVRLLPEPIAAAAYCAEVLGQEIPVGGTVAIFDFGGGTFDTAVVRRDPEGLRTLAFGGLDDLGGLDIDMALAAHLGRVVAGRDPALWKRLSEPETPADLRDRLAFWGEVRAAKEMLSRTSTAPVGLPGSDPMGLHLTRDELTSLADPLVARAVDETRRTVERAGVDPAALSALLLVGGSSRMPLVATRLHARLGVAPSVPEQPELPVAFGALKHAAAGRETAPPPTTAPPTTPIAHVTYAPYPVQSPAGSPPPQPVTGPPSPQAPPLGPSQPTPAGPYPPPAQTPHQAPFQPNVHTGPLPTGGAAGKSTRRWVAASMFSTIVTAVVIVLVVAMSRGNLTGLFEDLTSGDLVDGLTGNTATEGTGLELVHEQALTAAGAGAVAVGDGIAVVADIVDGQTVATAYDAAGTTLWTQQYDLEPTETHLMVVGSVLVIDALGSASDEGQNMRAAAALDTGELLWKQPWIDRNDVAFYGTDVVVEQRTGFDDNAVIRIDLTTGEQVWKKGGPDDLFIIDEYRIRAERVWNDGAEHPGTAPPNAYSLYDDLAVANRIVDLDPYEGTAVVRDAADGGSITSGDLPIDSYQWTAFDGLAVGKVSDEASPGRAVLAGYSLDDLGEAWRLEFAAGDAIVQVKPCGQHLVCAAVENTTAEKYETVAVDTQTGQQAWALPSNDWSDDEQWYATATGIVHGSQTFDTVDDARVVDFEGKDSGERYDSIGAIRSGRAVVQQVGVSIGATDWEVFVLDVATGHRTPVQSTGAELPNHVAVGGDLVAVHTGDGRALVLAASGLE